MLRLGLSDRMLAGLAAGTDPVADHSTAAAVAVVVASRQHSLEADNQSATGQNTVKLRSTVDDSMSTTRNPHWQCNCVKPAMAALRWS